MRTTDQAPVGFQLGFARAAQADTALLSLEVGPAADQAGGEVAQLGQFHLQFAFVGLGPLGEDIEDQRGAVEHPALAGFFDVAFLDGRQRLADQDEIGRTVLDPRSQFLDLAAADVKTGVRAVARGRDDADDVRTRRAREFLELVEGVGSGGPEFGMQDDSAVAALGAFKQWSASSECYSVSSSKTRTFRAGTTVEMACL